jgi:hypothetical protein
MRIFVFGLVAFAVVFGGGLLGFLLSRRLPDATTTLEPGRS